MGILLNPLFKSVIQFFEDTWFIPNFNFLSTCVNPGIIFLQIFTSENRVEEVALIPIFVCTPVFPTTECPLHVFEPRYKLMMRRCLSSNSKVFGMCMYDEINGYVRFFFLTQYFCVCKTTHLMSCYLYLSIIDLQTMERYFKFATTDTLMMVACWSIQWERNGSR